MKEMRLAILFSGNGSNLENVYKKMQGVDCANAKLNFILAISSNESAFGITRCANIGLKCEVVDYKKNKENFIPKIIELLEKNEIDLVILAGFMKILPPAFNAKFRAINIHPSILPLFKGANAIKESFESDMKIAGVSVHFVSDELDSGALIMQDIIHKIEGESLERFEARIHELEYEIYPKAIIKAIQMLGNSFFGWGNSSLDLHSADLADFGRSQTISLASHPKFAKSHKSQTENPSVVLSAESAESSLRGVANAEAIHESKKIDCHDSPKANLAMTKNNESTKSRNDGLFDSTNRTHNAKSAAESAPK